MSWAIRRYLNEHPFPSPGAQSIRDIKKLEHGWYIVSKSPEKPESCVMLVGERGLNFVLNDCYFMLVEVQQLYPKALIKPLKLERLR